MHPRTNESVKNVQWQTNLKNLRSAPITVNDLTGDCDLVLHEATFTDEHRQRAAEVGHSTARQAAEVARDAGAERLLLTHFSARYADPAELIAEAREVFPGTQAAEELARYEVRR